MQVTGTAKLLILLSVAGVGYGGLEGFPDLVAVSCGILVWLGFESLWFLYLSTIVLGRARVTRKIRDRTGLIQTMWEGRSYQIDTVVALPDERFSLALAQVALDVEDYPPAMLSVVDGSTFARTSQFASEVPIRYRVRSTELGIARFHGVRVKLTSPSGLFSTSHVVIQKDEYVTAPRVFQIGTPFPLLKQDNRLSPPGIHTHRRAGSGSELLEIREYQSGDPPKSIAWKMTARRDQLMSKQFECEVPLRCTVFLDKSASVYLRADRPPVIQPFVRVAATLIEFLTASRDPVGLVTFDAISFQVHQHSATRRASLRMIRSLTETISAIPNIDRPATNIGMLIRQALSLASIAYPELYENAHHRFGIHLLQAVRFRRRRMRRRYRIASILCAINDLEPYDLGRMLYDDQFLVGLLQRFLLEHQWGFGQRRTELDLDNVADPRKVENLTRLLRHAVARSRDPERFVILADLLHVAQHLSPLASAIRSAQAQGHRVSVVCAWDEDEAASNQLVAGELPKATTRNANSLFTTAQSTFLSRRFQQLQREMARAQVRVIGVNDASVMQQVLVQLQMARPGRIAT